MRAGKAGIPAEWIDNLAEWPRTVRWMEQLGARLAASCADHRKRSSLWITR